MAKREGSRRPSRDEVCRVLACLAGDPSPAGATTWPQGVEVIANWLRIHGLGALGYKAFFDGSPELAASLRTTCQDAAAHNLVLLHHFASVLPQIREAGIPVVLLKGAALVASVYGDLSVRPMTDIDIWVRDEDIENLVDILHKSGFKVHENKDRPIALQKMEKGEIQFHKNSVLIELHWSPFKGWWMLMTAEVDEQGVWERSEPIRSGLDDLIPEIADRRWPRQLSSEDMIIHLAVHLAVNHCFCTPALRGLMDLAITARSLDVNWALVAERARRWRLQIPVWLVLDLVDRLIGLPGAGDCICSLTPSRPRQSLLKRFIDEDRVITADTPIADRSRYLLLILLVARFRDAMRLLFRTVFPERSWMRARYQEPTSRLHHIRNVLLRGQI